MQTSSKSATHTSSSTKRRRFRPVGFFFGMAVGTAVASAWAAATGNPLLIAFAAPLGGAVGSVIGNMLVSFLKPNRSMING